MTWGPSDLDDHLNTDIRQAAEAISRGLTDHPSPDELVEYHLRTLPIEEEDRIQEHLSFCRECSQVVLDFAAFSEPVVASQEISPSLHQAWTLLQATRQLERRSPGGRFDLRLSWALAASILIALGLSAWNLKLRRDLGEERNPRTDIVMADLAPESSGERAMEIPSRLQLYPEQGQILLVLNLGDLRDFSTYRLELVEPGGGVVWAQAPVRRNNDGTFLLEIPSRMLETKLYKVRLFGLDDGRSIPLAEYAFEVARGNLPSLEK